MRLPCHVAGGKASASNDYDLDAFGELSPLSVTDRARRLLVIARPRFCASIPGMDHDKQLLASGQLTFGRLSLEV